eukprot:5878196-Karenia_brevis.AAC.1
MDTKCSASWSDTSVSTRMCWLCAQFDGGRREDGSASCGWHLQGCPRDHGLWEPTTWKTLAWGSVVLPVGTTTVDAELCGLVEATRAAVSWATT